MPNPNHKYFVFPNTNRMKLILGDIIYFEWTKVCLNQSKYTLQMDEINPKDSKG